VNTPPTRYHPLEFEITFCVKGVIFHKAGNLYGTTISGGANECGVVFQLTPSASGWAESPLYAFQCGIDGSPAAGVVFDSSGNLYGATYTGGSGGGGTVFELTPSNGSWSFTVLYSFTGNSACGPESNLTMDQAGNLYGTTVCDGAYGYGSVFKLKASGGGWTYTSVYDFKGGADGSYPNSGVLFDANGNLYGTASSGGAHGYGVVFEITP